MHDEIIGRPHSRISSHRVPFFDFPFLRRKTNTQAGSHITAPKATPREATAQGRAPRSREALVFLTGSIVSVVLAVLLDAKFRLLGLKLHVMYFERLAGRLHSSAMVPVKSVALHVICAVAVSPDKVTVGTVQLTLGGRSAIPESCTCCGLPLALSATFNVAVSEPAERLGVNLTLITQFDPAATLVPHGLVCEKSVAFAPVILMPVPVMLSAALPVLESVTVCAAEAVPDGCAAKVRELGFKLTTGAAGVTVRGDGAKTLLPSESVTVTLTRNSPAVVGVPEMTPVLELIVSPGGSPVALHV